MDKIDWSDIVFMLAIVFLLVFFGGEPDIADAVREYIFSLAKKGQ